MYRATRSGAVFGAHRGAERAAAELLQVGADRAVVQGAESASELLQDPDLEVVDRLGRDVVEGSCDERTLRSCTIVMAFPAES